MSELEEMKVGETEMWGMANLTPNETGLPMVVWVSEKGGAKHGPRIKVSTELGAKIDPGSTVTVTIEDNPRKIGSARLAAKHLTQVAEFIRKNSKVLIQYWERKISTKDMMDKIEKL